MSRTDQAAPGGLSGAASAGVSTAAGAAPMMEPAPPPPTFDERLAAATRELCEAKADLAKRKQAHQDAAAALDAAATANGEAQTRRDAAAQALVHLAGEG